MKLLRRALGASFSLLLCAGAARAQGEDARVLPRGYVAFTAGGEYTIFDSRTGGAQGGSLGAPFAAAFPPSSFAALGAARDSLARFFARTNRPGESFALGAEDVLPGTLDVGLSAQRSRAPLSLQAGIASRLNLRVTVPIEQSQTELTGARIRGGSIGFNPTATRDTLSKLLARIDTSLARLARQEYLPLAGSRAGQEIQARYARATGRADTLPLPTRGLSPAELNGLLRGAGRDTLGFRRTTLRDWRLGDVEVAAKLQLAGAPTGELSPGLTGTRVAVEAGVLLPTAQEVGRDTTLGVVREAGHAGATGAVFADFAMGRRVWVGTYVRYTHLLARDVERYTWDPARPFAPVDDVVTVQREPGARLEAVLSPRFQVTDQLALSALYAFGRAGETTYGGEIEEGAALAGLESTDARSAQSLGLGMSYSTLGAFAAGRASIPLEVALDYGTVLAGSGGAEDASTVRLSAR
ncbi:MAG TPA: hypothetical protein VF263_08110, partial [Longimicrobiaceae bacterium]